MGDRSGATAVERYTLSADWEIASAQPGSFDGPTAESLQRLTWHRARSLATVAAILADLGVWRMQDASPGLDANDWWFRHRFRRPAMAADSSLVLGLDGLATIADVWLNGEHLLASDNMFVGHQVILPATLPDANELLLRFRSLDQSLRERRPRPRWRAPMVANQQLRWFRTTLLGRTPGWSPPAAPVGPWRPIWIESRRYVEVEVQRLVTGVEAGRGWVTVACRLREIGPAKISRVSVTLSGHGESCSVPMSRNASGDYEARLEMPNVSLWWPHTHGEPALYSLRMEVELASDQNRVAFDLARVGFRTLHVDTDGGGFSVRVNGERIFCRGACWTPLDVVTLSATPEQTRAAIGQLVAAGMNMVRVGGTTVYEDDAFLDQCDQLGVLLWQDFMFANMDYPEDDPAFNASVARECRQLLARLAGRPCVAVLCGNSEVEQQAAMWGAPRAQWKHRLFHQWLPRQVSEQAAERCYWPSSACGGSFPHQADVGTTSYYGVGAYRRALPDARRAGVIFATECLALANVPSASTLENLAALGSLRVHSPLWKARTPRDLGAGWDFDDVRDHYFQELFGVAPLEVRYADHEHYLEASRVVSGEVMAQVFREWRRAGSRCNGGLILFLRDLWAGAGWGIIDADGTPKAPYYFLKRLLQPQAVFLTDEGTNGLFVQVANDTGAPLNAVLDIRLQRASGVKILHAETPLSVPARTTVALAATSMFDEFADLTHAYRFGPPICDVITVTLKSAAGVVLGRDWHFPAGLTLRDDGDLGLVAETSRLADGTIAVTLRAARLAQFVAVNVAGYRADEQYFHLAPGTEQIVHLQGSSTHERIRGEARALNSSLPAPIIV